MDMSSLAGLVTTTTLVAVGFLGMELITYVVHRFIMHGLLERLHMSHHRNAAAEFAKKSFESNDVFPLAFSVVVLAAMWAGFNLPGMQWLIPLFVGVTVYGVVYTVVHDGIIHGRVRWMKRSRSRLAANLAVAHRAHHRANGEPYGMLLPQLTMRASTAGDKTRREVSAGRAAAR
jgi:beta-carotene 3-hydroxylase